MPVKRRVFDDKAGLLPRMADIHCFELSDVMDQVQLLACDIHRRPGSADVLAFLPAPKTWLEWKNEDGRWAMLLEETSFGADVSIAIDNHKGFRSGAVITKIALRETLGALNPGDATYLHDDRITPGGALTTQFCIYAMLALINTPRIFGRRQHDPHRGLKRDLVRAKRVVGKFPLHAWTEIKLEITDDPRGDGGGPSGSVHYTGERAWHFCRAHLRIRLGKVEIVRWHERGNKALGIKQSRYRLTSKSKSKEEYVS